MSDGNGTNGTPAAPRILSLDQARQPMRKDNDLCTIAQARQLAAEEYTKVHEFYLNQIPPYVARMIQDALMSYGLIKLSDEAQLAATQVDASAAASGPQSETGTVAQEPTTSGGAASPKVVP